MCVCVCVCVYVRKDTQQGLVTVEHGDSREKPSEFDHKQPQSHRQSHQQPEESQTVNMLLKKAYNVHADLIHNMNAMCLITR